MKKTLFSAILAATFGFVALSAHAADGKITFLGHIDDVTCTVTGGAGTTSVGSDITVKLPTVSVSSLANAQDRAGDTPFALTVGGSGQTGCTNGKVVSLKFEGAQSAQLNAATGNLTNVTGSGMAGNVEIGLSNSNKAIMNLYTNTNPSTATIAANTATLNYWAQYVSTGGTTTRDVNTNVVFSLVYN